MNSHYSDSTCKEWNSFQVKLLLMFLRHLSEFLKKYIRFMQETSKNQIKSITNSKYNMKLITVQSPKQKLFVG